MGVIKRQGIKQSIVTYLGVMIGAVNVLLIYPLTLSPEEWGFIQFMTSATKILLPFVLLGSLYLIVRYFPYFKDEAKGHNGYLFFLLIIPLVGTALLAFIYFLLEDQILAYFAERSLFVFQYGRYLIPWILFLSLAAVFTRYCFNFKRIVVPAIFNDLLVKIGIPAFCLLYFWGWFSYTEVMKGIVWLHALILVLLIAYVAWLGQLYLRPNFKRFDRPMLKDMGTFAGFGILGSLGSAILPQIDTFMVGSMLSFTSAAVYTIPNFVTNAIDVPRKAIANVASPILAEAWKENDQEQVLELYQKTSINQFIIGLLLLVGLWVNIDALYQLIPESADRAAYETGKSVVLILGISKVFDMLTGVNSEIIGYSKYYRFNFYAILLLVVATILFNWIFIPILGIEGAALATLLAFSIFNLSKYFFLLSKLKMQPFTWNTLWVLLLGGLAYGVAYFIPAYPHPLLTIAAKSTVVCLVFGLPVYFLKLSEDINQLVDKVLRR